jgi:hypothetical protein
VLRLSQAVVVVQAALGGVLVLTGRHPPQLHVVYGLLPLLVSFIAEQLRVASAQMILDARGYGSAREVGGLEEEEQQRIVLAIVLREMGVMVLAALVNVVLLARARSHVRLRQQPRRNLREIARIALLLQQLRDHFAPR